MTTIEPFRKEDGERFLELAAVERWVAEAWEVDFLLSASPAGCFSARDASGAACGFVTTLRHQSSGWIGNLIVDSSCRGRGVGRTLFVAAMEALKKAGVGTIWLTASNMGKPMYEKHGFRAIDTIVRWDGSGRQGSGADVEAVGEVHVPAEVGSIDSGVWGDQRCGLLQATIGRGRLIRNPSGFAVLQPCGPAVQCGPFAALNDAAAESLLEQGLHAIPGGQKVYLDAPASNRAAKRIFGSTGMGVTGTNELMFAGQMPDYRPEMLYGLATLGSCG
ncbi:GNAT family N-acetyltransferase [Geobacter sp. SVR]|uniref:GNAT family N-acetyltransferase n=1 Tax=Geobacter sp. SVR TaxID=2495594 RepID=UPI00143EFB60|nr:GNAT family N-acetyltransferase [Geobacter sp. SVR]BCS55772.1 N-acetyltransferase [Geobacter sp. SVR]GCF83776.1 N-acetyltransferase [Geobacter sp. SVR]